jgi:hypothetical protein
MIEPTAVGAAIGFLVPALQPGSLNITPLSVSMQAYGARFPVRLSRKAMATNKDPNDGRLEGAIRQRSQFEHPNGHWIERNTQNGQITNVKHDEVPFRNVRREK